MDNSIKGSNTFLYIKQPYKLDLQSALYNYYLNPFFEKDMKLVALAFLAGTVAAVDYAQCTTDCMNTYIEAVNFDPYNSGRYATEYQNCVYDCYGFGAAASLATCSSCVNTYQTCVTNNPYNW